VAQARHRLEFGPSESRNPDVAVTSGRQAAAKRRGIGLGWLVSTYSWTEQLGSRSSPAPAVACSHLLGTRLDREECSA
jgi:hypothetical protein